MTEAGLQHEVLVYLEQPRHQAQHVPRVEILAEVSSEELLEMGYDT